MYMEMHLMTTNIPMPNWNILYPSRRTSVAMRVENSTSLSHRCRHACIACSIIINSRCWHLPRRLGRYLWQGALSLSVFGKEVASLSRSAASAVSQWWALQSVPTLCQAQGSFCGSDRDTRCRRVRSARCAAFLSLVETFSPTKGHENVNV